MVYGKYQGPTWQIKFGLDNVNQTKTYTLQIALATATVTELPVRNSRGTPWATLHNHNMWLRVYVSTY